jgi:hypothetical protein
MPSSPSKLIVQAPRGGRVEQQLHADPPAGAERIVLTTVAPGASGRVEPPDPGKVVYTLLSPEGLVRERDEVRAAVAAAGPGDEPAVVVLEAASELRADEVAAALDVLAAAERDLILAVLGDG